MKLTDSLNLSSRDLEWLASIAQAEGVAVDDLVRGIVSAAVADGSMVRKVVRQLSPRLLAERLRDRAEWEEFVARCGRTVVQWQANVARDARWRERSEANRRAKRAAQKKACDGLGGSGKRE